MSQGEVALVVVDVQNDFLPGGSLAVEHGDEIIQPINDMVAVAQAAGAVLIYSRDHHPEGHISFASSHPNQDVGTHIEGPHGKQVLWPDHCVQGSVGAEFPDTLTVPQSAVIVSKGTKPSVDSYSAFGAERGQLECTGMQSALEGVRHLFVCGLAMDVCVLATCEDGLALGFQVTLVHDATRAVDPMAGKEKVAALQRKHGQSFHVRSSTEACSLLRGTQPAQNDE